MDRELVSVVIPVKNASPWLDQCLHSVLIQSYRPLEVVVFEDCSEDNSVEILRKWEQIFKENNIPFIFVQNNTSKSKGCGYARNAGVANSSGTYICALDADDYMHESRIAQQVKACAEHPDSIVGSNFERVPEGSTTRYTQWCNSLTATHLVLHQYRECTIIHPTWFMRKSLFMKVGGYDDSGPGTPEDLIFFHKHLDLGGGLFKVDLPLVYYRYHHTQQSKQIHRLDLVQVRMDAFERRVLSKWDKFTIWSAGRDGKKFFNLLRDENKAKVIAFCDIDEKKIGTKYVNSITHHQIPIIHFSKAKPPIVICVALDRTNGEFEKNVHSLNLIEGVDYWHFC